MQKPDSNVETLGKGGRSNYLRTNQNAGCLQGIDQAFAHCRMQKMDAKTEIDESPSTLCVAMNAMID